MNLQPTVKYSLPPNEVGKKINRVRRIYIRIRFSPIGNDR